MKFAKYFLLLTVFFISTSAFAYQANCNTEDGRIFSIRVKDSILIVDDKYQHAYQKKTLTGWYEYANSKYTYKTGPFEGNGFSIEVINSRGQKFTGHCSLTK